MRIVAFDNATGSELDRALVSTTVDRQQASPSSEPGGGSDVFLSYARGDREFVKRLHEALVRNGKSVYVDWEDIPDWSRDYEAELFSGIDASDTFLFVLSPESLASANCKLELDHAAAQGKLIRPLLRRDVGGAVVPESLRRPQWLDFRGDEAFEELAARLLEALSVDADWVRRHTRIGLRAGEWDGRNRDASFLLRGSDLREAEEWLAEQAGREPPPTELQSRYVNASRRATSRRQRFAFGAVLVALAVAVALAVFAIRQRNHAIDQRDQATSLALAASANGKGFDTAALRAMEALRKWPTLQARQALTSLLEVSDGLVATRPSHGATSILYAPRAGVLVTGGDDGALRLWSVTRKREVGVLRAAAANAAISKLALASDGTAVAAVSDSGILTFWNIATRQRIGRPERLKIGVTSMAYARDGHTLLLGLLDLPPFATHLVAFDMRTRGAHELLGGSQDESASVSFSNAVTAIAAGPHGRFAYGTLSGALLSGSLGRQPLQGLGGLRLESAEEGVGVSVVAYTPDGGGIVAGTEDGRLDMWDVATGESLDNIAHGGAAIRALAFVGDNTVAWGDDTGRVIVHPLGQAAPAHTFHADNAAITGIAVVGKTLVCVGADGLLQWWDLSGRSGLARVVAPRNHHNVATAARDKPIVAEDDDGEGITFWDVRSRRIVGHVSYPRSISYAELSVSPSGRFVAATGNDAAVWDREERRWSRIVVPRDERVESIAVGDDGIVAAATYRDAYHVWLGHPGEMRPIHPGGSPIARSSNGRLLAIARALAGVDLTDGSHVWSLPDPSAHSGAESLAFSPDNTVLAAGFGDGTILLWDVRRRKLLGPLGATATSRNPAPVAPSENIEELVFDGDGSTLASVDNHGTIVLWDTASRAQLGAPLPDTGRHVAFGPDDVLTVAGSTKLRIVPVASVLGATAVEERLCAIVGRNLDPADVSELFNGYTPSVRCVHR